MTEEERNLYLKEKYAGLAFHTLNVFGTTVDPPHVLNKNFGEERIVRDKNGNIKVNARALDSSILTQEMFKGFYEYLFLDTSLPAKGEITEEEAEILKQATQNHILEPLGFVFGPVIAEKLNEMIFHFIQEDEYLVKKLTELDDIHKSPALTQALVAKVITMLDGKQIKMFYQKALKEEKIDKQLKDLLVDAKIAYDFS